MNEDIFNRFELTKKTLIPLTTFCLVFIGIATIQDLDKLTHISNLRNTSFFIGIGFLLILFIIIILELIFVIAGSFKYVGRIIGYLLTMIDRILELFSKIWVFLLKPILSPVIKAVIADDVLNNKIEYLQNKYLGREDDDSYFSQTFSTKRVTIICRPTKLYSRWRLGLKFSKDENFPETRYDTQHYLFHLTKDENNNSLFFHFYQNKLTHNYVKLIENYSQQAIKIEVSSDVKGIIINVYESTNKLLKSVRTIEFKNIQISAWADGRSPFELEVKVQNKL
ncbi:MAG: hypothetical protein ACOYUB_01065 [Patescibacteria group bacterium]